MFSFFNRGSIGSRSNASTGELTPSKAFNVLVIDPTDTDWKTVFEGSSPPSEKYDSLQVIQCGWNEIRLTGYADKTICDIIGKRKGGGVLSFTPHFVLVRSEVRGLNSDQDFRNVLYGLEYGGVPSVNSLQSIYDFLERPRVHAQLLKIQRRLGFDAFPLIRQTYYPTHRDMIIGPEFPAVVKVGHAHAGYGKIRVPNHHDFSDVSSVVAVAGLYCTGEKFLEADYDLRIQKIGEHYRCFKRTSVSANWKTNTGTSILEEIQMTTQYRMWADEASKMFGGLDICTVDAIHSIKDDKEYILEVNGTSSGFSPDTADIDNQHVRDLVFKRIHEEYNPAVEIEGKY
eukprot:GFYU01003173.1.p1 GENE.GFYU01003173.1~~GFYU01003173.1.p1  ORF type:complete len:355 (+),score=45.46 GFYU01003173.1:37-1065(+)